MRIHETEITFDKSEMETNDGDTVNKIRDEAELHFFEEIRRGQTLYFENINLEEGIIAYRLE